MPIVSQAEFARATGAGRSTVAGWIKAGIIDGDAIVRRDGKVMLDAELAARQVRTRRDIGQATGNGLHIRLAAGSRPQPAEPEPGPREFTAPDGRILVEASDDPYRHGLLAGALAMAYRQASTAVFYAEAAGAPMRVLHAMYPALVQAALEEVGLLCCGPCADGQLPLRYPAEWDASKVVPIDWQRFARDAGEPHDPQAWQAYADERRAFWEEREGLLDDEAPAAA